VHVGYALLTLFPNRVGGSETIAKGLLRAYAAGLGPERVTALANRHVMDAYGEPGGPVRMHHVRSYRPGDSNPTRLAAMLYARARPGAVARDVPPDLHVLHYPVTVPIPQSGLPTVLTLHDVQHHELPASFSALERRYRAWAYDAAARDATLVLTSSEHSRRSLVDLVGVDPDRLLVMSYGIDHERFQPDGPRASGQPERYVIYPANLWPHKNHERLLEAMAHVGEKDLHLLLTGQAYGREQELLDRARELGVGDRVHHLGFVPAAMVPELYRGAVAMVFPSLFEGFGAPPLEAMASGCPVVASDRGSLAEICGDAALVVDPHDPASIAAGIDRIAGDEALRAELVRRGVEHAAGFTWEASAAAHVAAYERALAA
jgi:glycosyltransferase involved in cell wall biosynthesis